MDLPDEWAGKQGRCPQCRKVLEIPAARPAQAARPPEPKLVEAAERATRSDEAESAAPAPPITAWPVKLWDWLRSPAWLATTLAATMLLAIGLFLVLRGGRGRPDNAGAASVAGEQGPAQPKRDVFRPAVQPADAGIEAPPAVDVAPAATPGAQATAARRPPEPQKAAQAGGPAPDALSLKEHGVEIPIGAGVIEIDGVLMPVQHPSALAARGGVPLVLPLGKHIVRFARSGPPQVIEPRRWFLEAYLEAAGQVQENGRWSFDRLLELSRRSLDRFREPLVPHFWGNYYWQEGEHEAAARSFTWALQIAPTFAPSYFNLAGLAHERGDDDAARRYLRLADLWNVQNAYGLARASLQLRASLRENDALPADDEPDWLVRDHSELTGRDRDLIAVLSSAAEFAPRLTERAKILNNLGAYFEHEAKSELALEHYRSAAAVLGSTQLAPEQRQVILGILNNLARVCRKADMPEYLRYERMQTMVQP
jgi:tetratricopeptide (TPR) repeat protein